MSHLAEKKLLPAYIMFVSVFPICILLSRALFFKNDDEEEGDEKEAEEDDDDGFFVPHGYLSDDEGIHNDSDEEGGETFNAKVY